MQISLAQAYSFHQLGQRDNQEDSRFPDSDMPDEGQRFFAVCDGVGGSTKGEVASSVVCGAVGKHLSNTDFAATDFDNDHFRQLLDAAYDALDDAADRSSRDMATTFTFVCFHRGGCLMAHIGDSRIYQIRPGKGILYCSEDHSLVNSMVHAGVITPDEAIHHPQSNVITRYMGPVDADQSRCMSTVTQTKDINTGDYFFLCTDGVLHRITDEELVNIISSDTSDWEKISIISSRCADSPDNNTAILIPVAFAEGVSSGSYSMSDGQNETDTHRLPPNMRITVEIASISKEKKRGLFYSIKKLMGRLPH